MERVLFPNNLHNCSLIKAPEALSVFSATSSAILCLLTATGNLLVILAFMIDPYKELQAQFNFFVVNLAVADLIVGIVTEPLSVFGHSKEASGVPWDEMLDLIQTAQFSFFVSVSASLLSIAALWIDRITAIRIPLHYRAHLSFKKKLSATIAVWVLAFGVSCVYFKTGFLLMTLVMTSVIILFTLAIIVITYFLLYRTLLQRMARVSPLGFTTSVILSMSVPNKPGDSQGVSSSKSQCCCNDKKEMPDKISVCNNNNNVLASQQRVPHQNKSLGNEQNGNIKQISSNSFSGTFTHSRYHQRIRLQNKKLLTVLLIVVGAFLACYIPVCIITFYLSFSTDDNCLLLHWLRDFMIFFAIVSSSFNPFIYTLRLRAFRMAILAIVRGRPHGKSRKQTRPKRRVSPYHS